MSTRKTPTVSVLTPVYNGERFLAECIDSVLSQTMQDWEYVIVDNRSTDRTAEIAAAYAARDARIRLVQCAEFVDVHRNFCRSARLMDPAARFCKFLAADDWMYPQCLESMVAVAEKYPSVGVVSSYRLEAEWVQNDGLLSYDRDLISGTEVVRRALLGGPYVTGSPSQLLYRADLVRRPESFFDVTVWHGDTDAAFRTLLDCDLGFVHQVLTFTRLHPGALTSSFAHRMNTFIPHELRMLVRYGTRVLGEAEYKRMLRTWLQRYAWFLAKQRVKPSRHSNAKFHAFHRNDIARIMEEPGADRRTRAVLRAVRAMLRDLRVVDSPAPWTAGNEAVKAANEEDRAKKAIRMSN